MIKASNFDSIPYYVGINTGHLGFLQEVKKEELDKLVKEIKRKKYKVSNIDIQETLINGKDKYHSLNEMVIRDGDLNVLKTDIYINDDFLEEFTGDGILIATSIGSTACNISYGGSIVSPEFSTLQITPIAPINSKVYRTLSNSIVEPGRIKIGSRYKKTIIKLVPKNRRVIISIDGDNKEIEDVDSVCSSIEDKKIKMLRFSHYNFPQKINEKLLSN